MFNPTQADVRRFFCQVYAQAQSGQAIEALALLASQWINEHPQYHPDLADVQSALTREYQGDATHSNPFLHLSLHLSISEQCSIDQPRGIRQAVQLLTERQGDLHQAHHLVMEALTAMLWQSQQSGQPPDGAAYVEQIQRLATRSMA